MLTTETIKKAEQFADGFEASETALHYEYISIDGMHTCTWCMMNEVDSPLYDLFLDRVIQGFIYKKDLYLQHGKDFIFIMIGYDFDNSQKFEHDGSTTVIRRAREQAIEWVIERIGS